MVHIWVINEHASSHSRLKSFVQKGLELPALLYITEDADRRGLQVQLIEQSALGQILQNGRALSLPAANPTATANGVDGASASANPDGAAAPEQNGAAPAAESASAMSPQPAADEFEMAPQAQHDATLESSASESTSANESASVQPSTTPPAVSSAAPHEGLSVRELQTLMLLGQGLSVSGIARNLALSVKTISTYRSRALEKLHLNTTADLIRYAVEHLLLPANTDASNRSIG